MNLKRGTVVLENSTKFNRRRGMRNDVSVIIVNWNARDYLINCIKSIILSMEDVAIEIIVVDNNSTDDSEVQVRKLFPQVKLVLNKSNEGFSKANNRGIRISKGKYICLVNSDVIVLKNCFQTIMEYMENNPDVGICTPKMLDGEGRIGHAGMLFPNLQNTLIRAFALDSLFPRSRRLSSYLMSFFDFRKTCDMEVLFGFFWMIRREALESAGLLDERFFIYGEDIDLCKRFKELGWRNVYLVEAAVIHFGGASSSNQPLRFYLEMLRANCKYIEKHFGGMRTRMYELLLIIHHLIRLCGYLGICIWFGNLHRNAYKKVRLNLESLRFLVSGTGFEVMTGMTNDGRRA